MLPDDVPLEQAAARTIVLKAPTIEDRGRGIQPGVLLITFTDTYRFFAHHVRLTLLQRYFHVVLEPSWAGYALPEILFWLEGAQPVIVQSTEPSDRAFLHSLQANLIPVDFGASNWVDHRIFTPLATRKKYDAVYVANYTPMKRVHVFFRALNQIRRHAPDFRAALVCSSWGGQRDTVFRLIDYYRIADLLEVLEDLQHREVNEVLNRAKCNVLLSRKEGSNRSLFESMFADTAVILLDENVGVNKDYINRQTGIIVDEADFSQALLRMKRSWANFSPRNWALQNIAPEVTTRRLARILEDVHNHPVGALNDLAIKVNTPEVAYFHEAAEDGRKEQMRTLLRVLSSPSPRPSVLVETLQDIAKRLPGSG